MKKIWRIAAATAALCIVISCASSVSAQDVITGAYGEASTTDPEVVAATRFAIATQARRQGSRITLLSISRAELQVVAGLNYKMWLTVRTRGKTQNVTTVVYKNLKRRQSLTSWDVESSPASSGPAPSTSTIEQLVASLAEAFTSRSLGKLDADRPYVGRVKVVIEHSLAPDNARDRFEISTFNTLAKAEAWLRRRETSDDTPARETRPLQRCRNGVCTYDFGGGISHNQLYLKRVSYGLRRGRPYIKTIYLLDGD